MARVSEKRANLSSAKIPMVPLHDMTNTNSVHRVHSSSLLSYFEILKTFISSLYVSLVNNLTQHMCISNKYHSRMQVILKTNKSSHWVVEYILCKFLRLRSTLYRGQRWTIKSNYFNLVKAINYITVGLFCPPKFGTICVKMILIK